MSKGAKRKKRVAKPRSSIKIQLLTAIGGSYYFLLYYFVHVYFLHDWIFSPTLVNVYEGFYIEQIVLSALRLWELVPVGLSVEHWVYFVLWAVWYALPVVWAARRIIIYAVFFFNLVRYLRFWVLSKACLASITLDHQVTIRNGAPGAGKTRMAVFEAIVLAGLLWERLCYRRWLMSKDVAKWEKENNTEKLEDWYEVNETYKYYTTPHEVVCADGSTKNVYVLPSLFSSIGINYNGRYSSKLTLDHALCKKRAPGYTLLFYDEWGTIFDIDYSTSNIPGVDRLSDNGRFIRQFGEQIISGTEQDSANTYINMRRVVSRNDYMLSCKDVLKPFILGTIFRLLSRLFGRLQVGAKVFGGFMSGLESVVNAIGFTVFIYRPEGNTEHRQGFEGLERFVMRKTPELKYDTRAFRRLSFTRNQPIEGEPHTSLAIDPTEENKQAFLRSMFDERDSIQPPDEDELATMESSYWSLEDKKRKNAMNRKKYPEQYQRFLDEYLR